MWLKLAFKELNIQKIINICYARCYVTGSYSHIYAKFGKTCWCKTCFVTWDKTKQTTWRDCCVFGAACQLSAAPCVSAAAASHESDQPEGFFTATFTFGTCFNPQQHRQNDWNQIGSDRTALSWSRNKTHCSVWGTGFCSVEIKKQPTEKTNPMDTEISLQNMLVQFGSFWRK